MWDFISNNLFVLPTLLSIILMLYIVYIMDTDPNPYCASEKQRKHIQMQIYPLLIFSPSAQLFLACGMYILIFLNLLKKLQPK